MSTFIRKIVFGIVGLLGGLAAWPIAELFLTFQHGFPSLLIFTISLGITVGAFMGGFLGSTEGITLSIKSKIIPGIITGAIVGIAGGVVGFLTGQGALLIVSDYIFYSNKSLSAIGIPVSRVIGWAFLGVFIGSVEGVRALSSSKIKVGVFGGLVGGLLGGASLELLRLQYPELMFARLAGLMVLGGLIGFFYGLFEKGMSHGVLRLLNGKLKGKEYLLLQRKIKVGNSPKADIQLNDYKEIADFHAKISIKKDKVTIGQVDENNRVIVNEVKIKDQILKFEDVVQIGSAKFLFFYK